MAYQMPTKKMGWLDTGRSQGQDSGEGRRYRIYQRRVEIKAFEDVMAR
jgi:hypothetical protein